MDSSVRDSRDDNRLAGRVTDQTTPIRNASGELGSVRLTSVAKGDNRQAKRELVISTGLVRARAPGLRRHAGPSTQQDRPDHGGLYAVAVGGHPGGVEAAWREPGEGEMRPTAVLRCCTEWQRPCRSGGTWPLTRRFTLRGRGRL